MDLQVAKRGHSDVSGADAVLAVLLPGDEGLAEPACGTPEHHGSLGKQVSESSHHKVQFPLPAGLDVYISGSGNVRAVLRGRPSRPWLDRDARPKEKEQRTGKNQSEIGPRERARDKGEDLFCCFRPGLPFTTSCLPGRS